MDRRTIKKYDWKAVQKFLDKGNNIPQALARFGMHESTFFKAMERGDFKYTKLELYVTFDEYAKSMNGQRCKAHHRRRLKEKLIKEGVKRRCAKCKIETWRGKRISFDLDHINGDSRHNTKQNVRLLCPNCHSQTKTWRGRNKTRYECK